MASPMTYDVILREKDNPTKQLRYPLNGMDSVCFFRISHHFEDIEDEWVEHAVCPVLDSLVYYFSEDYLKADEVKAIMICLFDNCGYDVQWEVSPCEVINDCDHQMFLTGFGEMPRGLFMNKMFCIRNLIRDKASFLAYKAMIEGGVPLNIAAYFGGALEVCQGWQSRQYTGLKDYAGYIEYNKGDLVSIVRGMANNIYCEQDSLPWNEGWGYNCMVGGSQDEEGNWKPIPTEITGAVAKYQGIALPEGMTKRDVFDMSDETVQTLLRFICNNDKVTYSTQKES